MSDQQIGDNPMFRLPSSSCVELQNSYYKGMFSQKGLIQPQLLEVFEEEERNSGLKNLGFAGLLQKNDDERYDSADTLQLLVQSCSCGSRSHEKSSLSRGNDCQQSKPIFERLRNLTCERNIGATTENYYYDNPELEKQHRTKSIAPAHVATKHKSRIRWSEDLHKKFIECVHHLGGAKKATPKGIVKLMKCDGLTIFHVKSHLQKYRVAELMQEAKEGNTDQLESTTGVQIVEALRLQIDVQRRLYEQLESQKKLQMRIEEQAKQLQTMLECQLNTK